MVSSPPDHSPAPLPATPTRSALSWRSVTLGMIGVAIICLLTPYNDYVLWNTFMVGNSLPLAAMMLTFLLAALVNGPLSLWKPRWMLSAGELGIIMAMMLVCSALPASALMRYFPGSLVYPFFNASSNAEMLGLLSRMDLPDWLFPSFEGDTPAEWGRDPIVTGFASRWSQDTTPPYGAWIQPLLTWGVYFIAFHGAVLCLLVIVRRQWYENERLSFPLAQIQLALLATPKPGRWFGGMMARRAFWVVFIGINIVHAINALHVYQPAHFPEIPVRYDLVNLFSEQPLTYMNWSLKMATIFFTAVGVAYLLPGAVSFSLWFFAVASGLWAIPVGMMTGDPYMPGMRDQHFGGMLAYGGIVIWIGRRHWVMVLRQAFGRARPNDPRGRYMSYPAAFWLFVTFVSLMIGWMITMGMTPPAAVLITGLMLLAFFLVARIVAETGLLHPGNLLDLVRPWQVMSYYSGEHPVPVQSFYRGTMFQIIHYDARESFGVFASHSLKITDETIFNDASASARAHRSTGRKIVLLFAVVLVVGFLLSYASMIWVEYKYAYELHDQEPQPVNRHVALNAINGTIMWQTQVYDTLNYNYTYDPASHLAGGAAGTILLAVMRLRYAWWPFHPVGYLFMDSWPMRQLWFSIMLGWAVRTLALRFGGAKLYMTLQPAMMGLIIGEAFASGIWLILGLLFSSTGMPFFPIRFTLG